MAQTILSNSIPNLGRRSEPRGSKPKRFPRRSRLVPVIVAAFLLILWQATTGNASRSFVLASPEAVLREFIKLTSSGILPTHIATTLLQTAIGFFGGVSAALLLGYGIARNRWLEQIVGPYAVGFQAVPLIAIAPVLIQLVGPGVPTIATISGLIVFFPMLVSTMVGLRNISPELRALMRSLNATRWQTFLKLEVPAALPTLLGGLKISTTLALAGTIVGEAFSPTGGLGFLIYSSRFTFNRAGVLVGVITLTILGLAFYELVARLERRVLAWQRAGQR